MSEFATLALYPLWAVAALIGSTTLRLGRAPGLGLVAVAFSITVWVTGLILLEHPASRGVAIHVLPAGMLMAGTFVHAGFDLTGFPGRRWVSVAYGWGLAVAALGAWSPSYFHDASLTSPGPLFWPVAIPSAIATVVIVVGLLREGRARAGTERRRIYALALGCAFGSFGGGASVGVQVLGFGDVAYAAPFLLPAVVLLAYATLSRQPAPARILVRQAVAYGVITAAVSAVALPAFVWLLPELAPELSIGWLALVSFFVALPLDSLRTLFVERVGRYLFQNPSGVADLATRAEESASRAEHAEALAQVGVMASAVAHELRNPLGVIAAQAMLLERAGAPERSVASVRAQVDRAKHFLDDLLRYSKPKELDLQMLALREVVEDVARDARSRWPGRSVVVEVEPGLELEADRHAVGDVLTILIDNALAARPEASVWVHAEWEPEAFVLFVDDDGSGVPDAIRERLFEPFVTGRGRDHEQPGTGLGLAIAQRWMDRHGGRISLEEPSPRGGARFCVRFPRSG